MNTLHYVRLEGLVDALFSRGSAVFFLKDCHVSFFYFFVRARGLSTKQTVVLPRSEVKQRRN